MQQAEQQWEVDGDLLGFAPELLVNELIVWISCLFPEAIKWAQAQVQSDTHDNEGDNCFL